MSNIVQGHSHSAMGLLLNGANLGFMNQPKLAFAARPPPPLTSSKPSHPTPVSHSPHHPNINPAQTLTRKQFARTHQAPEHHIDEHSSLPVLYRECMLTFGLEGKQICTTPAYPLILTDTNTPLFRSFFSDIVSNSVFSFLCQALKAVSTPATLLL